MDLIKSSFYLTAFQKKRLDVESFNQHFQFFSVHYETKNAR